jgi:hypothetical protein
MGFFHIGNSLSNQVTDYIQSEKKKASQNYVCVKRNSGQRWNDHFLPVDAEILEKEFYAIFSAEDLVGLPNHLIHTKCLMALCRGRLDP